MCGVFSTEFFGFHTIVVSYAVISCLAVRVKRFWLNRREFDKCSANFIVCPASCTNWEVCATIADSHYNKTPILSRNLGRRGSGLYKVLSVRVTYRKRGRYFPSRVNMCVVVSRSDTAEPRSDVPHRSDCCACGTDKVKP